MDSSKVSSICNGLSDWYPFNKESVKKAPNLKGVYVFRMAKGKPVSRLRGESDIMYIGSTKNKNGLRRRFQQYLRPSRKQYTNMRVHELLKKYEMEIAWWTCDEPNNVELQLLRKYFQEHDELPPLNRAGKRLTKKELVLSIQAIPEVSIAS